ncbi:MAG: aminotransferase class III-fold pyridoxal phosphate-dependent enzyme, partial [Candidatus Bathyarchaeota archaeon]|nr:aminotransferase class III-fold pyridoxal phosphate-dependent enzyme [Candidatus Bathyarchaeota archaeon]
MIKAKPPGPNAKSWIERWELCGSKPPRYQTAFSSGKGVYLEDIDGNRYLDLTATTCNIGHTQPKISDAVIHQLKKSGVEGFRYGVHGLRVLLAEKIKRIVPAGLAMGKVAFCTTGSDATEFAMKLARAYTRRQILFSYMGSHHGYSMGALSLTADYSINKRYCLPLVPSILHIPYPYCYRCYFGQVYPECSLQCLDFIRYVLNTAAHPDEVAAIFLEPIQQIGGVVIPPKEYFVELRKICDKYQILLVDDEVATGFGR